MPDARPRNPSRTAWRLVFIVLGMFGFGFAMVPFYNVFCDITGINGNTSGVKSAARDVGGYAVDASRTVRVQFVANLNNALNWEFRPRVFEMRVHPGELVTAEFIARNRRPEAVVGQAIPSVMPGVAARHFHKTECFCFTQQRFEGGEQRVMPVRFMVDPDLPREVTTVILSYTFFDVSQTAAKKNDGRTTITNGG